MRLFVAILICRLAYFFGSKIGRGSALPGKIALKACPDALSRLKLPSVVIAVTGSNGKTSTAELIAHALERGGMSVGWNFEGSNQTEGIATLILRKSAFAGRVKCDSLVLECDERYAAKIFAEVRPTALLVTNLCRDQLTRNGHHEFIQDCLREAIAAHGEGVTLVINADDPYVAALGADALGADTASGGVCWFGIDRDAVAGGSGSVSGADAATGGAGGGMYDDGAFCPRCKARMGYDYRIAAHFGGFRCSACGLARQKPHIEVTKLDTKSGEIAFGEVSLGGANDASGAVKTRLAHPSLNNAYNLAAAIAAVQTAGVDAESAARGLDNYELKGGRTMLLPVGSRAAMLCICKHENSLAYNQTLKWVVGQGKSCTVIIMVDSISRKYYTSETSWLWDVDFDLLTADSIKEIVLTGRYSGELGMRFMMSSVSLEKCRQIEDAAKLREYIGKCDTEDVYVLTCFADKAKLLKTLKL